MTPAFNVLVPVHPQLRALDHGRGYPREARRHGRFRAYSAGSDPIAGPQSRCAGEARARFGHDTNGLRSKSWNEFTGPERAAHGFRHHALRHAGRSESARISATLAVTAAWPLPDPAKFTGSAVERGAMLNELYASLRRRIEIFIALPFASLDRMALKARLDELGGGPASAQRARADHARRHQWHGPHRPPRAARRARRDVSRRRTIRVPDNRLDIVHVNELKGGAATTAHLLEFDSIHGRWREQLRRRGRPGDHHRQPAHRLQRRSRRPDAVAWGDLGCDIVLECTGKFLKQEQLAGYFDARREAGDRRGAGERSGGAQPRRRRQRPPAMIRASTGC